MTKIVANSVEGPPAARLTQRGNAIEPIWWAATGYFAMIILCSLWLRADGVMVEGQKLNFDRAIFISVSAATLTGFQQTIGPNDFHGSQGPIILILLTVAGSLMTMIIAGLAAVRILRLPFSDRQIILGALTAELLAILAGTAALYTGHADLVDAVLQSACAFGNSGAVITAKSAASDGHSRFPGFASWQAQCVLLPLSILGGLGLPVVLELYHRLFGGIKSFSKNSRTVISLSAGVYLFATILLFFTAISHHDSTVSTRSLFLASSTTAINARTGGLPFEILHLFPGPGQMLIVLLIMIGAGPAGTAGGLKVTTFWHLCTGFRRVLRGRPVDRAFGIAAVWLVAYLFLAALGSLILSASAPQMPVEQAGFQTLSALSNVGLSHDPVSAVGGALLVLDLIMLCGRIAPLLLIWWMASTTTNTDVLVT